MGSRKQVNSIMWREVGNVLVAEMNITLEGTESFKSK